MQARLGGGVRRPQWCEGLPSNPAQNLQGRPYSLHHRVPAGREVVSAAIDEGHPEVEEQVDEKGPRVLGQEDLGAGPGREGHPSAAEDQSSPVTLLI